MKIAILTTYFHPEENGLTRYIEGLYSALLKNHPEIVVDVITFDTLKTGKMCEEWGKFKIHRVKSWQFLGRTYAIPTPKGFLQLKKIFVQNQYDVINTHTRFFFSSFLGIWFGKKYAIPVVHTEHGSGFVQSGNLIVDLMARIYDQTIGRYTLASADVVCGTSQSVCNFARKFGAKKTEAIYNGIGMNFWQTKTEKEKTKKTLGIKENDIVLSFVGRLVPSKGCQDLISALAGEMDFSWKLFIVGDGFYKNKLMQIIKKKRLEQKIFVLGHKNKKELRDILQVSDVYVNSSFAAESGPRTLLEAAASGCKCISTEIGLASEILSADAIYKARDIEKLRERIFYYEKLSVPDVSRFDWEVIAEKYSELLLVLS